MDRTIVYSGALPQTIDVLNTNKYAQVGLGYALRGILGANTVVHNLACTPTTPASLQVTVGTGAIYTIDTLDASAYSDSGLDAHQIVKQGLLLDPVTLTIVPPVTSGQSQVFLVQVILSDVDTGTAVLPYFNATNPTAPFSGPGNNGMSQFTTRSVVCTIALKAGTSAPTGSQTTPTPDSGYTGLYAITVSNGQTAITSGNIVLLTTAPFFPTLPSIPNDVQTSTWTYCVDVGLQNAMAATVYPPVTTLVPGSIAYVRTTFGNTGPATFNLNGTGAQPVHRANGAALSSGDYNTNEVLGLIWDGGAWQIMNFFGFTASTTNNNSFVLTIPYCVDIGIANAISAPFSPVITSLSAGMMILVKIAAANTGATTITVNALGAVPVVRTDVKALTGGDIVTGEVALMVYDGTRFQLVSMPSSLPRNLTAPMTFFVATTGSDISGDGLTLGTAFATVQKALDVMNTYTNYGFVFTIIVANGTYPPFVCNAINGTGSCKILGNQANPQLCIINEVSGNQFADAIAVFGQNYQLAGFKVQSTAGNGLAVAEVGSARIWNFDFGVCGQSHQAVTFGGKLITDGSLAPGGFGFIHVSGSSLFHILCSGQSTFSTITNINTALVITASMFTEYWAFCVGQSFVGAYYNSITGAGNVFSGFKFNVAGNSVIDVAGQGVNYLPAPNSGSIGSGGQYI